MNVKTIIQHRLFQVVVMSVLLLFFGCVNDQQDAISKEVQDMIQKAEKLSQEGKYGEALRLLYDAQYKEERALLSRAMSRDETLESEPDNVAPRTAADTGIHLIRSLIQKIPCPLMEFFRDPDVPVQEKLGIIHELRALTIQDRQEKEAMVIQGKKCEPFLQLLTSRTLSQPEKMDVLFWMEAAIKNEYTSAAQKQRVKEEIAHLQQRADQKLQKRQYVEAFVLLDEALQKARDIDYAGVDLQALFRQQHHIMNVFFQTDESPLMQVFKNPQISSRTKRQLKSALLELANASDKVNTFSFQGETYTGPMVQILCHPKIDNQTKSSILEAIERMIEQGKF